MRPGSWETSAPAAMPMNPRGTRAVAEAGRRARTSSASSPARRVPGPGIGEGTRDFGGSCGRAAGPVSGRSAGGAEGAKKRRLATGVAPDRPLERAPAGVGQGLGGVVEGQPGGAVVAADDLAPGPGPPLVGLAAEGLRRRVPGVVDGPRGRPEDGGDTGPGRPEPEIEVLRVEEDPLVERTEDAEGVRPGGQ